MSDVIREYCSSLVSLCKTLEEYYDSENVRIKIRLDALDRCIKQDISALLFQKSVSLEGGQYCWELRLERADNNIEYVIIEFLQTNVLWV